jgi:hypothetical protein
MMTVPNQSQDGTPDDGQTGYPKHVEFHYRIKLDNYCVWLVIKKEPIKMHGNMIVKFLV